jgi:hypothetical protein
MGGAPVVCSPRDRRGFRTNEPLAWDYQLYGRLPPSSSVSVAAHRNGTPVGMVPGLAPRSAVRGVRVFPATGDPPDRNSVPARGVAQGYGDGAPSMGRRP